ncbi:hypothetical protein ACW5WQ_07975 [Aeromonas rivuli]|uniref:hypothetical protein n=1 Tax=Aeromonas rivuli TaxID=648794 RepID=UPI0012ED8BE8|nr:hypothetical protein [Aeromonas rivuli]
MTTNYTERDSKLTFLLPEAFDVSRFGLVEYRSTTVINRTRYPDHTHVFTFTQLDAQPGSRFNQALHNAIRDKTIVQLRVTRNGSVIRDLNVVVSESATEEPNDYRLSVVKA